MKYIRTKDLELEVSHYLLCEKESEAITLEELKELINRLPSFEHYRGADMCDFYIDTKHGEWQITDAYPHNVYCSECHERFAQTHWTVWEDGSLPRNFCPNCGADMRGKDK